MSLYLRKVHSVYYHCTWLATEVELFSEEISQVEHDLDKRRAAGQLKVHKLEEAVKKSGNYQQQTCQHDL